MDLPVVHELNQTHVRTPVCTDSRQQQSIVRVPQRFPATNQNIVPHYTAVHASRPLTSLFVLFSSDGQVPSCAVLLG